MTDPIREKPTLIDLACFEAFHEEPPSEEDIARYSADDAASRIIWKYPRELADIIRAKLREAVPAKAVSKPTMRFAKGWNACLKAMGVEQ